MSKRYKELWDADPDRVLDQIDKDVERVMAATHGRIDSLDDKLENSMTVVVDKIEGLERRVAGRVYAGGSRSHALKDALSKKGLAAAETLEAMQADGKAQGTGRLADPIFAAATGLDYARVQMAPDPGARVLPSPETPTATVTAPGGKAPHHGRGQSRDRP